jgi:hypothetical protein
MQYKTITLELIRERPVLYEQLRSSKRLLTAMDAYAIDLKTIHDQLKEAIASKRPGSDPSQIASEALELAVLNLRDRLPCELPNDEQEPLSLDAAMNFIRKHTPPA